MLVVSEGVPDILPKAYISTSYLGISLIRGLFLF